MAVKYFKISWIQKVKIYRTQTTFLVIGSNNAETKFRILKIERTDPSSLLACEDEVIYTSSQVESLLESLQAGPATSLLGRPSAKLLAPKYTGFGLIGFIRFLEGYYMILITKRNKVAEICGNTIYKVEDTCTIYIPNHTSKVSHRDEYRYLKMFQTVDLSSNFYFSYSYDLTNSLQHNMLLLQNSQSVESCELPSFDIESDGSTSESWVHVSDKELAQIKKMDSQAIQEVPVGDGEVKHVKSPRLAVGLAPCGRYLWNAFFLEPMELAHISSLWNLHMIHGHVTQTCIDVFGKQIYITLIGRRSSFFAGTRFMKRGCNINGDVANEVETEQVVHCASTTSLRHAQLTSYVQHRGSVPVHWSQDITASVVPSKPPIVITMDNPFAQSTALHFQAMMKRYGSPIMVLNLVRKKDRRFRESALGEDFKIAVDYLNQFLRNEHQIKYYALDMAHLSRHLKSNVLNQLAGIAECSVWETGIFQSKPHLFKSTLDADPRWQKLGGQILGGYRIQTGVLRTNCVDCLDRTNSAQFVAGKCALAHQLFSLGVLSEPSIDFDTDTTRLYEEMFNEHGDVIALQYGGSQLVHTIQSYRRTVAPWTSHRRDIFTTLSRYYSNTFSDADKQSAINLFLGMFRPHREAKPLWETSTDYYLHNSSTQVLRSLSQHNYARWWHPDVVRCLPFPSDTVTILKVNNSQAWPWPSEGRADDEAEDQITDWFDEFYQTSELTVFDECLQLNLPNTLSECVSRGYADVSPFAVRDENWQKMKHEHMSRDSTLSLRSLDSSNGSSESDDNVFDEKRDFLDETVTDHRNGSSPWLRRATLEEFSPKFMYGIDIDHATSPDDLRIYQKYLDYETIFSNDSGSSELETDSGISLPSTDPQSLKTYRQCVSHAYPVDRQAYVDYLNEFNW